MSKASTDMTSLSLSKLIRLSLLLILFSSSFPVLAQTIDELDVASTNNVDRLEILQTLLDGTLETREQIRATIKKADAAELPELQLALEAINADVKKHEASFEQVAIGSVDVSLLGEIDTSFDWRDEVSEILRPIVENMKSLTDKPRKIGKLQSVIEQNEIHAQAIDSALRSIDNKLSANSNESIQVSLLELQRVWQRYDDDNVQALEIAQLQLRDLQNYDVSWGEVAKTELTEFFKGRGLTLAIALAVVLAVWFLMRALLNLFQLKSKHEDQQEYKTRKRLAQYAYNILIALLIMIAVLTVFYIRGDMLLMGLSILATAAVALGLRQAIPRFITEGKLLLNVGAIRENERVIFNGLPWQVVSLNMSSVLKNPELTGVLRLPMSVLNTLVSRPAGKEPWFPASKGNYIVLEDNSLFEVVRQTPETVELRSRGGEITAVPSAEFYNWTFRNLSRGKSFGVTSTFGVDYKHQGISLKDVPTQFKTAIEAALSSTAYADSVTDVKVELSSAGSSSLDYWLHLTVDADAAKHFQAIHRMVQQTCVLTCSEKDWGIPFPHVTIVPQ